jgi:hypothetical protein
MKKENKTNKKTESDSSQLSIGNLQGKLKESELDADSVA